METETPEHELPRRLRKRRSGFLTLGTAFYLLLLGGLWLSNVIGPERWALGTASLYLPPWGWALPAPILGLLWWRVSRQAALLHLLPLFWVAGPVMGLCWVGGQTPGRGKPLRVMTYNVEWTKRGHVLEVSREIGAAQPDLLLVQDTSGRLGDVLRAAHPEWHVERVGQYLIASANPLENVTERPMPGVNGKEAPHITYARCRIRTGGATLTIYNAHLLTPRDGLTALRLGRFAPLSANAADRLRQAETLADAVSAETGPLILAGDFNAPPASLVCQKLKAAGLRDAFEEGGRGYGYTFGHSLRFGHSYARLDHIFVSRQLRVDSCRTGGPGGADHRPVIAELWLE